MDSYTANFDFRQELAALIRRYLAEEITAFQFDEALGKFHNCQDDPTVRKIALMLWFHYDDVKDHTVVASKSQWDFFQRLLLILDSDAQIEQTRERVWSWHQLAAGIGVAICLVAIMWFGIGHHLILISLLLAPFAVLLTFHRRCRKDREHPAEPQLHPFGSLRELSYLRRSVSHFKKQPYPRRLLNKRIRSSLLEYTISIPWWITSSLLSPLVLLAYTLPDRRCQVRVTYGFVMEPGKRQS